jgi:hypothetical protein
MELTKDVYLSRKKRDESDANIMKEFAIGKTAFMNMKKRWGLIGTRSKKTTPTHVDAQPQVEAEVLKWKEEARRLSERVADLTEELRTSRAVSAQLESRIQFLDEVLKSAQQYNSRLPETENELQLLKSLLKLYL